MITRVLDEDNSVLHDCIAQGCSVSWDGIALKDLTVADVYAGAKVIPPTAVGVKTGSALLSASGPDLNLYSVGNTIAKLKRRGG